MNFKMSELHADHYVVKAAQAMVIAHSDNQGMTAACEAVLGEYPKLTHDQIMVMWIAVNAKDRDNK